MGEKNKVIVVGGGKFGEALVERLQKKYDVYLIERDKNKAEKIAEKYDILVINGDATTNDVLLQADVKNADVLVSLTGEENINLMVCQLAKKFGVKKTISRINLKEHESFFKESGIDVVISPPSIVAASIEGAIHDTLPENVVQICNGEAELIEIPVGENSEASGKKIKDLSIPKECIISAIVRGQKLIIPKGDTKIKEGDVLSIVVKSEYLGKLLESLK